MTWIDTLDALYATTLTERQAEIWDEFLLEKHPTNNELCAAIRMAASEDIKPIEWRVTVRDLLKWLAVYRSRQRAGRSSAEHQAHLSAIVKTYSEKFNRGVVRDDIIIGVESEGLALKDTNEVLRQVFNRRE